MRRMWLGREIVVIGLTPLIQVRPFANVVPKLCQQCRTNLIFSSCFHLIMRYAIKA